MNLQNLMAQLMNAQNPAQMIMGLMQPNSKDLLNSFTSLSNEAQAQKIADICNQKGITKEQLTAIYNQLKK